MNSIEKRELNKVTVYLLKWIKMLRTQNVRKKLKLPIQFVSLSSVWKEFTREKCLQKYSSERKKRERKNKNFAKTLLRK